MLHCCSDSALAVLLRNATQTLELQNSMLVFAVVLTYFAFGAFQPVQRAARGVDALSRFELPRSHYSTRLASFLNHTLYFLVTTRERFETLCAHTERTCRWCHEAVMKRTRSSRQNCSDEKGSHELETRQENWTTLHDKQQASLDALGRSK